MEFKKLTKKKKKKKKRNYPCLEQMRQIISSEVDIVKCPGTNSGSWKLFYSKLNK